MKIETGDFKVREGKKVRLRKWPTKIKKAYKSDHDYAEKLAAQVAALSKRQELFYAANKYAVLFIFQAMDAGGKDGAIAHVMSGVNPQGCQVFSFKHPTPAELQHDFLWRTTRNMPERGRIGIFNRSYYEEVLIARVHPDILAHENVPDLPGHRKKVWEERYRSIVGLERHMHENGTRIVKFFLHLSKDEQKKRFLERIADPDKNWKMEASDVEERAYWDDYQTAYEECISATSTEEAPWYIVPADDKKTARLVISQIVLDTLEDMKLDWPKSGPARARELKAMRRALEADD